MNKKRPKRELNPKMCQLLIWSVPRELKDKFKATCAEADKSMRQVILSSMAEYIALHRH